MTSPHVSTQAQWQLITLIGSLSDELANDEENAALLHQRGLLRVELHKAAKSLRVSAFMDDHLGDACMDFEEALHFSEDGEEIALIHEAYGNALSLSGNHEVATTHYERMNDINQR